MSTRRKPQSRNPAARPEDKAAKMEERGARGTATVPDDDAPETSTAADSASKVAAVGLWVVVGGGLVYGVSQTLVKVIALFGG